MPTGNVTGFGVDGQPRNWGSDGRAVKPALDMLVNDLGANFFRVEVNDGESDWEVVNDDANPKHFEWPVLDADFNTDEFADLAAYVRYLNQLGINHVELAEHGGIADWLCSQPDEADHLCYSLDEAAEDEWVESALAPLVYLRTRAAYPQPQFDLFSPINESEFSPPEGFKIDPTMQGARVIRKLVDRMNELPELDGVKLVISESASEPGMITFRQAIQNDDVVMARLAATSFHRYSDASTWTTWNNSSPPVWLTEFNSTWNASCYSTTWTMGMEAAGNLISALKAGITAGLAWSDYDAPHIHQDNEWQTFGLLATHDGALSEAQLCGHYNNTQPADAVLDAMTYTPKPTYRALRHAFKYIRPNAAPVPVSASGSSVMAVAYKNADGTFAVFGRNNGSATNSTVTLTTTNPPSYLTPRTTTASTTDVVGAAVALTSGQGTFNLPAQSVFTLLSSPGDGSGGSGGMGGAPNGGAGGGASGNSGVGATAGASGMAQGGQSGASSGGQAGLDTGGQSGSGGVAGDQGGMSGSGGASGAGGLSGSAGTAGASGGLGGQAGGASGAGAGGAAAGASGAGGSTGLPPLIAGWSFDEGTGTVANDASGHGHTGTVASGVTWTTTGCKFGGCLSFPGTSGKRVTVPDANDLDLTSNFTLMAWVLPSNVTPYRTVMIKEESAGLVYLLYAAPKEAWLDFGGGDVQLGATSGNLSTTAWLHVAFTYDGATGKYWVNGSVTGSTSASGNVKASTGVLGIGGHAFWGGEWFAGKIDDPRIYGGAMTAAQIATAMGAGL